MKNLILLLIASFAVSAHAQSVDLQDAASRGQLAILKKNLKTVKQANTKNSAGENLMIAAVHSEDLATVKFVLSKGGNPHLADKEGQTALFYAVSLGQPEIVQEILKKSKSADLDTPFGAKKEAVIFEACRIGNVDVINSLLKKNKNLVSALNSDSENALFECVRSSQSEAAAVLVKAGANKNQKNKSGQKAADLADPETDQALLKVLK